MNIEDYREYCLSLGEDIEEKLPFQKFKNGEGVLRHSMSVSGTRTTNHPNTG